MGYIDKRRDLLMDFNQLVLTINGFLADKLLVFALVGVGLWFTINLGFIQVRGFGEAWRRTFGGMFKNPVKPVQTVCLLSRRLQQQSPLR